MPWQLKKHRDSLTFAFFLFILPPPPFFIGWWGGIYILLLEIETLGFTALNKNVTPYSFVDRYQCFGGTCCLKMDTSPPKHWCLFIRVHSVTSQKTVCAVISKHRYLYILVVENHIPGSYDVTRNRYYPCPLKCPSRV